MTQAIAASATVSFSNATSGVWLQRADGSVCGPGEDNWASFDVRVHIELDDGRRISAADHDYKIGRPLDCSVEEFEQSVRSGIFSEPAQLPPERVPGDNEAWFLVGLRREGIHATGEVLRALPFTVLIDDEVKARLET